MKRPIPVVVPKLARLRKSALSDVVAPPLMVRPDACVPPPMVEEPFAKRLLVKKVPEEVPLRKLRVPLMVELPCTQRLLAKRRPDEVAFPTERMVEKRFVEEAVVAKSDVEVPAPPEKKRLVVEAVVAKKFVVVAFVDVELRKVMF